MKSAIVTAIVDSFGRVRQLTGPREPAEEVTDAKLADVKYVARLWMRTLRDLADVKRRFYPRRLDFEDVHVDATGTTLYRFEHGFADRVRWWVVDATVAPKLAWNGASDASTLVLTSTVACSITLRVEAAG